MIIDRLYISYIFSIMLAYESWIPYIDDFQNVLISKNTENAFDKENYKVEKINRIIEGY